MIFVHLLILVLIIYYVCGEDELDQIEWLSSFLTCLKKDTSSSSQEGYPKPSVGHIKILPFVFVGSAFVLTWGFCSSLDTLVKGMGSGADSTNIYYHLKLLYHHRLHLLLNYCCHYYHGSFEMPPTRHIYLLI